MDLEACTERAEGGGNAVVDAERCAANEYPGVFEEMGGMATVEDAVGWDGGERVGVDEPGYADVTGGVERDGFGTDVKAGNLPCGG